jgi:hypothetical protein
MLKRTLFFILLIFITACGGGGNDSSKGDSGSSVGSWSISTIDTIGFEQAYISMVLDANNKVHISYSDLDKGELKYTTNAASFWNIYVIDTDIWWTDVSIAVDSKGIVHIVYFDPTSTEVGDLKYATNSSGSWIIETIDLNQGHYNSIAVDSNDNIHIYYSTLHDAGIKYATNSSGSWVLSTIYSSGSRITNHISLAFDSLNNAHLAYYEYANTVNYMTNASGSWSGEIIDTVGGPLAGRASIAIDSQDKVHIGYNNVGIGTLKYATNASGSWVVSEIGDLKGQEPSIALDSFDRAHITAYELNNADLLYITNKSGGWNSELIETEENVGLRSNIKIDSEDRIHISYFLSVYYSHTDLKYAFK